MALSNGGVIEKTLKVGKTERYTLGLAAWLNGEALTSAALAGDGKAELSPVDITDADVNWFATGVEKGACRVTVDYQTATRSDRQTVTIIVI